MTEQIIALAARAGLNPHRQEPYAGSYLVGLDAKSGPDSWCGSITVGAKSGRILRAQLVNPGKGLVRDYKGAVAIRSALKAYIELQKTGEF
ncbi:hypothetical protein ACFC1T_09235 [Kitasatospora sp. NPDC056076]|uniref:hypothetical protein n=1 Tax=Kitasatospora sp. NPDC056076 TaxID=3345703 RepID=UPI0035D6C538